MIHRPLFLFASFWPGESIKDWMVFHALCPNNHVTQVLPFAWETVNSKSPNRYLQFL